MLLLDDSVLNGVLKIFFPQDYSDRIKEFKNKFFSIVEKKIERIALTSTKTAIDEKLATQKIEEDSSLERMKSNLQEITNFNIEGVYESKILEIKEIIQERDYEKLLLICNLKKEISKGLANKELDNDYIEKAKQQILTNASLKLTLRNKYLNF